MPDVSPTEEPSRGFYSKAFERGFKKLFVPLSRLLHTMGITPNAVTWFSFVLACITSYTIATDHLWITVFFGLAMGFADTVDGQIAKEYGMESAFGGILDSTIDRYNEFMVFLGLGLRYYFLERPAWIIPCTVAFLGSIMISYIKARAEADGFECKVGRLQRPERLTIIGFGCLFLSPGVDVMIVFLAVATQMTAMYRLVYVYKQSRNI